MIGPEAGQVKPMPLSTLIMQAINTYIFFPFIFATPRDTWFKRGCCNLCRLVPAFDSCPTGNVPQARIIYVPTQILRAQAACYTRVLLSLLGTPSILQRESVTRRTAPLTDVSIQVIYGSELVSKVISILLASHVSVSAHVIHILQASASTELQMFTAVPVFQKYVRYALLVH